MQAEQGGLRDRGVKRCSRRGVGDYGGECGGTDIYGYMTVRGYGGKVHASHFSCAVFGDRLALSAWVWRLGGKR